jgi:hypothetical protein
MAVPIPSKSGSSYNPINYPSNYRGGGIYNERAKPIIKEDITPIKELSEEELYGLEYVGNGIYKDDKGRKFKKIKGEWNRQLTSSQRKRVQSANLTRLESMGVLTKSPEGNYLSQQGVQKYNENVRQQNALNEQQPELIGYEDPVAQRSVLFRNQEESKAYVKELNKASSPLNNNYDYTTLKGKDFFQDRQGNITTQERDYIVATLNVDRQHTLMQSSEDNLIGFGERISAQEKRQTDFFGSLERIRPSANWITFGNGEEYSKRSFFGKVAENLVFTFEAAPLALGGSVAMGFEKLALTGEALTYKETRGNILPTYRSAILPTLKETFPNPYSAEGASYYTSIVLGAGLDVGMKAKAVKADLLNFEPKTMRQIDKPNILYSLEKTRATELRYTKTNLPKSDYIISDIVKFKGSSFEETPTILKTKFEFGGKSGSGTRTIIQDIVKGKTSVIDRIQKEGIFFKNQKGDFIRTIEQTGDTSFKIDVFKTKDYINKVNPKPFTSKTIIDLNKPLSLGTSKEIISIIQEPRGKVAKQSGQIIIRRESLIGDYLQKSEFKITTTQRASLEKGYFVTATKEPALIITGKEKYIGFAEKYKSIKSVIEFGKEKLEPNLIEIEGSKTTLSKYPQKIGELFTKKDIDIQLIKLTSKQKELYLKSQKGTISKGYLSDLNLKELKMLSNQKGLTAQERVFNKFGGLQTEVISFEKPIIKTKISSQLPKNSFENLGKYSFNIPELKQSSRMNFKLIPSSFKEQKQPTKERFKSIFEKRNVFKNSLRPINRNDLELIPIQELRQQPQQKQEQRLQQKQEQKLIQTLDEGKQQPNKPKETLFNMRYPKIITPRLPPLLFKLPQRNKITSKKYKQKREDRFKYKYTPTIEAAIFNIRAKKTNMREAKTGLFLRPILTRNL